MKKKVQGVEYETVPQSSPIDRHERPHTQSCVGCAAQYDMLLCEQLQGCFDDQLIWKRN